MHIVASEGLEAYLPLADMVDISAEIQRLSKRLEKMQADYDGLIARLSSPKVSVSLFNSLTPYLIFPSVYIYLNETFFFVCKQFVEKAPEEIVHGVREKAAEAEEKLKLTRNQLAILKSTVLVSK